MGKTTRFSSLTFNKKEGTIKDETGDQESLTIEDDDMDTVEQHDETDGECSYMPANVQNLTEEDQLDNEGEDDDDEEDDDSDSFQVVVNLKSRLWSLRTVLVSGHGLICVYVGLVILLIGSGVSLVIVCIHVVRPYITVSDFRSTECYTIGLTKEGTRGCMCGIGCNNRYSCFLITVTYPTQHNQTWMNATMYEDESIIESQCSFFPPCRSSQPRIDSFMGNYMHKYTPIGRRLPCYHSLSRDVNYVIRTRRYHAYHVVHGLLWTNMGLIASVIGLVYRYRRNRCTIV